MKKRVILSILAACIVLSSGCSKPVDNQTGELNTKAEVTLASGEATKSVLDEPVESGIDKEQPTTQESAEATDVSVEQTTAPDEHVTPVDTEPVTEEPTEPATESVTEPVTEPAAEVIPTQKETTAPKVTESTAAAPTQPATQKATAAQSAPTQSATQKPTTAPTQPATQPATEAATQKQTEAATEKATTAPTTAPAPTEEATEAPTREKTAWDYPWDLDAIEAELRAYGESLGLTYYDEEYIRATWQQNPQVQQWWTLDEWVEKCTLTPETANWRVPTCMYSDENEYLVGRNQSDLRAELEYIAKTYGTTGFRIYFELDETATTCIVYVLY